MPGKPVSNPSATAKKHDKARVDHAAAIAAAQLARDQVVDALDVATAQLQNVKERDEALPTRMEDAVLSADSTAVSALHEEGRRLADERAAAEAKVRALTARRVAADKALYEARLAGEHAVQIAGIRRLFDSQLRLLDLAVEVDKCLEEMAEAEVASAGVRRDLCPSRESAQHFLNQAFDAQRRYRSNGGLRLVRTNWPHIGGSEQRLRDEIAALSKNIDASSRSGAARVLAKRGILAPEGVVVRYVPIPQPSSPSPSPTSSSVRPTRWLVYSSLANAEHAREDILKAGHADCPAPRRTMGGNWAILSPNEKGQLEPTWATA